MNPVARFTPIKAKFIPIKPLYTPVKPQNTPFKSIQVSQTMFPQQKEPHMTLCGLTI